mgnify:CR=1 FL=1
MIYQKLIMINTMKRVLILVFTAAVWTGLAAQDKFTDTRDGNTYRTITVAGSTWMAENLKYVGTEKGANYFDNNPGNMKAYGVLYEWNTAMEVCPDGWHLPTGNEYRHLLDYIFTADNTKKQGPGPDLMGFQLAGMKNHEGIFTEMDEGGYYWTSTEYTPNEAEFFSCIIVNGNPVIDISRKEDMPDIHGAEKTNKYSVRCVRNQQ